MSQAYVDTSAILALVFTEAGWEDQADRLDSFSTVVSSNLLEAEVRAAFAREGRSLPSRVLANIEWLYPTRALSSEFAAVLRVGYLRGADLWHLACAMYVSQNPEGIAFITRDQRQRTVADALGFQT